LPQKKDFLLREKPTPRQTGRKLKELALAQKEAKRLQGSRTRALFEDQVSRKGEKAPDRGERPQKKDLILPELRKGSRGPKMLSQKGLIPLAKGALLAHQGPHRGKNIILLSLKKKGNWENGPRHEKKKGSGFS